MSKTTTYLLVGLGVLVLFVLFKQKSTAAPVTQKAPSNPWDFASNIAGAAINGVTSIWTSSRGQTTSSVGTQTDGSFDISGSRAVAGDGDVLGGDA